MKFPLKMSLFATQRSVKVDPFTVPVPVANSQLPVTIPDPVKFVINEHRLPQKEKTAVVVEAVEKGALSINSPLPAQARAYGTGAIAPTVRNDAPEQSRAEVMTNAPVADTLAG